MSDDSIATSPETACAFAYGFHARAAAALTSAKDNPNLAERIMTDALRDIARRGLDVVAALGAAGVDVDGVLAGIHAIADTDNEEVEMN